MPMGVGAGGYAVTVDDLERARRRIWYYAKPQYERYNPYLSGLIQTLHNCRKDGYYTHELKPEDHKIIHWALFQIGP
jgi:hypothetical protein